MAEELPPYRPCDLCGGVDQDPRHSFVGVVPDQFAVAEDMRPAVEANLASLIDAGKLDLPTALGVSGAFNDTSTTDRHKDCCASAGCPTGTCGAELQGANGKTGPALRKHILSRVEG